MTGTTDQVQLRTKLQDMDLALRLLNVDTKDVNWQSIAVLLYHTDKDLEIVTRLINKRYGWAKRGIGNYEATSLYLSPKGMVYWLEHAGHHFLYGELFGCNQASLDNAGWLHISGGRVDISARPTDAQEYWLSKNYPAQVEDPDRRGWPRDHNGQFLWKRAEVDQNISATRVPTPYPKGARFDVRPIHGDILTNDAAWNRLYARILAADTPN